MNIYTIKQISAELKVTPQTIRNYVKNLPGELVEKQGKRFYVTQEGFDKLVILVSKNHAEKVEYKIVEDKTLLKKIHELEQEITLLKKENKSVNETKDILQGLMENASAEKAALQTTIEKLQDSNANFQKLLDQQQHLQAQTNQKVLELQAPKQGFFNRLFKGQN